MKQKIFTLFSVAQIPSLPISCTLLEGYAVLECYLSNIAEGVSVISSCDKFSHSWRTWEDALYLSVLVFQAQKNI